MKQIHLIQFLLLWLLSCSQLALADRITYFHYDATGTAIMATDEQANVLWKRAPTAYGETPEVHPAMKKYNHRMTVAGHYDDWETGLIYMGKRYYSPKLGRFLTPDPVGVHPHLPQSFNRYGYANNNPYRFVDPDGRSSLNHLRKLLVNGGNLRETFQGQIDDISTLVNPQQSLAARGLALASLASEVLPVSGRDVKGLYRWLSPCSFTAGTQVSIADGLTNIENIDIGAQVWALANTNSSPALLKLADVTGVYRRLVDSTYTLQVGDEQIEVTGEHPFWVYHRGWLTVEQLRIGDLLRSKDGAAIPIKAIQQKHQRVTVYNLEVDQLHNYFAGKSQVLVHNCVSKRTFTSSDNYVANVANEIENAYPGHVIGVNVPVYDAAGKLVTDADILLKNAVIQVKTKGKGMASQLQRTEQATGLPAIGYGPKLKQSILKNSTSTNDLKTLIEVVKP